MIYLKEFDSHASYETEVNGGGVDFKIPNVSYCKDVKDVHFNPYNLIKFYVGEITPPQTVKIYTDRSTSIPIQVSEGNKWYSYVLPKNKGLCKIEGDSVKKVVVKADISFQQTGNFPGNIINFIPSSTVEASFKGSNTTNVTNISFMFYGMESLISLDLSNFNTSNVTNMNNMFSYCSGHTSLNLSKFNTSNVTDMHNMFGSCGGLTSLDVSSFDTSKVTDMGDMFCYCSGLTSLDLSKFDTSNVTDMGSMFFGCRSLNSLVLSGWNTSKVNNTTDMFKGCTSLSTITMVGCSEETRTKIEEALTAARIKDNVKITT